MKLDLNGKKRILCVSDIHGYYDGFMRLMDKTQYDSDEDLLIIHGDLADRGNQNVKMIYKAMELQKKGAIILKGNHDLMATYSLYDLFLDKKTNNSQFHIACDGYNTYKEFLQLDKKQMVEIYNFLHELPLYYINGDYIFVHAGVDVEIPFEENTENEFLWMKNEFFYNKAYDNKIIIYGHTDTAIISRTYNINFIGEHKIFIDPAFNDKIGIDCGYAYGGKLACLELPTMKEYYV